MSDILKHLDVNVHCEQCGDFSVRADVIAESQRLLAEGCPGSVYECPPQLLATLLSSSGLKSLQRAWDDLQRSTQASIGQVTFTDCPRVDVTPGGELDPHAVARWEDDGGRPEAKVREVKATSCRREEARLAQDERCSDGSRWRTNSMLPGNAGWTPISTSSA